MVFVLPGGAGHLLGQHGGVHLRLRARPEGRQLDGKLRVASVDIGGGTSDVMIAEYEDKLPGTGTSLSITKLFQDGVGIAGDEVCRAIVEDVIFPQIVAQLPTQESKGKLLHLFGEGDAGHGSAWRTLRARLVPYLWLPLARCYWSVAEGFALPDHAPEKMYLLTYVFEIFGLPGISAQVLGEADRFLESEVEGFPGIENLFLKFDAREVERAVERVLREPLRRYADILAQFDVDLLVLAGRTAALPCIKDLFTKEMPVPPPRIKSMARYRVGEWYPSKWKDQGHIKDPKSTVTAGASVLHLASKNKLPGFLIDAIAPAPEKPIYGLYQDTEPHIARANELFRKGNTSQPFVYTHGMRIGFRNVDSQEMEGSPLFEVRPANADVEAALLEDRVSITFDLTRDGNIQVGKVTSQTQPVLVRADRLRSRLENRGVRQILARHRGVRRRARLRDEMDEERIKQAVLSAIERRRFRARARGGRRQSGTGTGTRHAATTPAARPVPGDRYADSSSRGSCSATSSTTRSSGRDRRIGRFRCGSSSPSSARCSPATGRRRPRQRRARVHARERPQLLLPRRDGRARRRSASASR